MMMMTKPNEEVLHVFGKILYSLAMADGEVQESELTTLREIVSNNDWAKEIEFSFNEAMELEMDPHISFLKNMRVFASRDLDQHFPFFLELMEKIAEAHNSISSAEFAMIEGFKSYSKKGGRDRRENQLKSDEMLQILAV